MSETLRMAERSVMQRADEVLRWFFAEQAASADRTRNVSAEVIAAIKLDTRGPVLFRQMRIGRDGNFAAWSYLDIYARVMLRSLSNTRVADGPRRRKSRRLALGRNTPGSGDFYG